VGERAEVERRRSDRVGVSLPVAVEWRGVRHEARAISVNEYGAALSTPFTCPAGTVLDVENRATGARARARVVWAWFGEGVSRFTLGVEFVSAEADFWGEEYRERSRVPSAPPFGFPGGTPPSTSH